MFILEHRIRLQRCLALHDRDMIVFCIFLAIAGAQPNAKAAVVVRRGVRASEKHWKSLQSRHQRELIRIEDGRPIRIRAVEFE